MKKLYFLPAAALTALLCGCSSDDALEEGGSPTSVDKDGTYYVSVLINGDSNGSRASSANGSPEDGDTDFSGAEEGSHESDIDRAFFVFYDTDGNVVGDVVELNLGDAITENLTNTTEVRYRAVVPVSVRVGEYKPSQVVCYINPISTTSLQMPLHTMMTQERSGVLYQSNGQNRFAMSTSVYYPNAVNGSAPSNEALPLYATTFVNDGDDSILFETRQEALDELAKTDSKKVVEVYVERYASKLTFQSTDPAPYYATTRVYPTTTADDKGYDKKQVTLTFQPVKWALNAEAKSVYTLKSFREVSTAGVLLSNDYTYSGLDNAIKNRYGNLTWAWNNATYHRSYWGMSPAYYTNNYPIVSSDVKTMDLKQTYLKYSEVEADGFDVETTANPTPQYFKPTTVGTIALNGGNPAAAVPSVILVGKYKVEIDGTEVNIPEGKGFYTYGTDMAIPTGATAPSEATAVILFDDEDNNPGTSCVSEGGSILMRFLAQQRVLYKKVGDDYVLLSYTDETDKATMLKYLEVVEISDDVKANTGDATPLKLQANARSLQLKTDVTVTEGKTYSTETGIYVVTGSGYQEIVADGTTINESEQKITLSSANAQLMQSVGYAYYYKLGMAYYSIPVRHLGFYRTDNPNNAADATGIEWSYVNVGDFGMVRNHSYKIVVESITGLASGIANELDPIVPPATTTDYYVAYAVNILKWAIVPTQTVNL